MKRLLTIFMVAILLLSTVLSVACAEKGPDNNGDNNNSNSEWLDNLPDDLDFGGEECLIVFAEGGDTFTARSIWVDPETAEDSVDKAIAARNAAVEQRLNVQITSFQAADSIAGLKNAINNSLAGGNGEYDIIAGYQYYDIGFVMDGYMIDLNEIGKEDSVYAADTNYIDIDADYWATNYINSLTYGDSVYWVTGDLALRYLGGMYCTFVNATIYNDYLLETYGDIYQIAKDGKWTIQLLNQMAEAAYVDRGTIDVTDIEDQLGYAWESNDPIDGLAIASNIRFSTRYSDGSIDITIGEKHTIEFAEQLEKLLTSKYSLNVQDRDSAEVMETFASGNLAFTVNKLFQAEARLRGMTDNYYILPAPKLDENQANYVTGIHDGITIFGVPHDAPDVSMSTAVLEALAAESLKSVTPVYYESSLKFKYTRDDIASQMIDIMRDTANTDFAAAWSSQIDNMVHIFRTNYKASILNTALKSKSQSYRTKLETLLDKLTEED